MPPTSRHGVLAGRQDAFGQLVRDFHRGQPVIELIERDDGWLEESGGPAPYFAPFGDWPRLERAAIRFARGRVLDVGAGAGRVALHLQARGHDVVAIDNSVLAVQTARLRGVRQARVVPVTKIGPRLGTFDTVVMLGNNLGLLGGERRARWLLRRLAHVTAPDGRIIAATLDPYDTRSAHHRRYHRWNRARGRMGGQVRLRVRYHDAATPWFDYLFVSRPELRRLLAGTPWRVERVIDSRGPQYCVILAKGG